MDGEYYCRLAKAGCRFRFLPQTIAAFTWHDNNVSTVFRERRLSETQRIRQCFLPLPRPFRRWERFWYRVLARVGRRWRHFLIVFRVFTEGKLYLR